MGVRLGVICVVIGSSLMFLVFFVYVFDKENLFISVLSQHICNACDIWQILGTSWRSSAVDAHSKECA